MNPEIAITTLLVTFALGLGAIVLLNIFFTQFGKGKQAKVQLYSRTKLVRVTPSEVYASFGVEARPIPMASNIAMSSRDKRKAKGVANRAMAHLCNGSCCITCHKRRMEYAIQIIEEMIPIQRDPVRANGRIASCTIKFV